MRLPYAEALGKLRLRQVALGAVANNCNRHRPCERGTFPFPRELRTLKMLRQDLPRPDKLCLCRHATRPPPEPTAGPGQCYRTRKPTGINACFRANCGDHHHFAHLTIERAPWTAPSPRPQLNNVAATLTFRNAFTLFSDYSFIRLTATIAGK